MPRRHCRTWSRRSRSCRGTPGQQVSAATAAEAASLLADALGLVCPPRASEAQRSGALTLLLRYLVCLHLEDRGMGSAPSALDDLVDHFAEIHRRCAAELFAPGPFETFIGELSDDRWLPFSAKLREARQAIADPISLGRLYQQLQEIRPGLDHGRRKTSGSYYTPQALAETTVARCLDPLLGDNLEPATILALRICDPAMGSAAFLLEALAYLAARLRCAYRESGQDVTLSACRQKIASNCLYGVDLDPLAVQLGGLLLWYAVDDIDASAGKDAAHLKQGNALVGAGPGCFDWQQEFPEVFASARAGFDAIIGNPPWETLKPDSREFFARHDPDYARLSKQEALLRQAELCCDAAIDRDWQSLCEQHKALSQYCKTEYRHQGVADLNAYKLFLERGFGLLAEGGCLAFLVPAGIYCDRGSKALRELFLDHGRWDWLFGFENRQRMFPIDSRFKFCAILVRKGGRTKSIRCAFMQRSVDSWRSADTRSFAYRREEVERYSPNHKVLVEFASREDRRVFSKIHAAGQPLGETGEGSWDLHYGREFDTTMDSKLFPTRPEWEQRGYRPCADGRWLQGDWQRHDQNHTPEGALPSTDGLEFILPGSITGEALPLYEGRMIEAFSCRAKAWVAGRGRRATWTRLADEDSDLGPQYLMAACVYRGSAKARPGPKVAFMRIASATNERSCIATYLRDLPMADSLFLYRSGRDSLIDCLCASAILNSFCFDYQVRCRLGGLNMSEFLMSEVVLPNWSETAEIAPVLAGLCACLSLGHRMFDAEVAELEAQGIACHPFARTHFERAHLRSLLDALIARLYGLDQEDLSFILRDCDHPVANLRSRVFRSQLIPKGFWRVDRGLPPEQRLPALTLARFGELRDLGLSRFLETHHLLARLAGERLV